MMWTGGRGNTMNRKVKTEGKAKKSYIQRVKRRTRIMRTWVCRYFCRDSRRCSGVGSGFAVRRIEMKRRTIMWELRAGFCRRIYRGFSADNPASVHDLDDIDPIHASTVNLQN